MLSIRSLPCALRRTAVVVVIAVLTPAAGRAAPAAVTTQQATQQTTQQTAVSGTVKDASGNALAGATVRVPAAGRSVISDGDGRFRIKDLPPGEYTLTATHIGYSDATLTAIARIDESAAADIVMEASAVALAGSPYTAS